MERIPIVIDVDTGTDDAIAIICALQNLDLLEIKAFTAGIHLWMVICRTCMMSWLCVRFCSLV